MGRSAVCQPIAVLPCPRWSKKRLRLLALASFVRCGRAPRPAGRGSGRWVVASVSLQVDGRLFRWGLFHDLQPRSWVALRKLTELGSLQDM